MCKIHFRQHANHYTAILQVCFFLAETHVYGRVLTLHLAFAISDDIPEQLSLALPSCPDVAIGKICGQTGANLRAFRTPLHAEAVTGGKKRREPSGGAA